MGHDLALGHHDDLVGDLGGELDVVRGQEDGVVVSGEVGDDARERRLAGVVEAAGRFVEQHHRRPGGEHDGQRQREPLSLGQVARVDGVGSTPGASRSSRPRQVPGSASAPVSAAAHSSVDGLEVEQVGGGLRDQPDVRTPLGGGEVAGSSPATLIVPDRRAARALQRPDQAGLARAVAAHQDRDPRRRRA